MPKRVHKPTTYSRTDKTGQLLQEALAKLIQQEVRDPRMPKLVTVSRVVVSPDLSNAKVYFTVLESPEVGQKTAEILNHAAGYLRGLLTKLVQLRIAPRLHFFYDSALGEATRLSNLITQLNENVEEPEEE
jgi:ribosome-binding factor A